MSNLTFHIFHDDTSDDVVRDLLLLIGEKVSLETIATWTEDQKFLACVWAGRIFAKANDNAGIKIPKRPEFLPTRENAHA